MGKAITVQVEGLERVQQKLNQLPAKLTKEIGNAIGFGVAKMVGLAQKDAPADEGILRAGITFRKVDALNYDYLSNALHSPFMEFGTGAKVNIPTGYEDYAAEFKGKKYGGGFDAFFLAILDWVHRKGISGTYSVKSHRRTGSKGTQFQEDYNVAFLIALKILKVGVTPHPFFFRQVDRVKPEISKNIKSILDRVSL